MLLPCCLSIFVYCCSCLLMLVLAMLLMFKLVCSLSIILVLDSWLPMQCCSCCFGCLCLYVSKFCLLGWFVQICGSYRGDDLCFLSLFWFPSILPVHIKNGGNSLQKVCFIVCSTLLGWVDLFSQALSFLYYFDFSWHLIKFYLPKKN